MKIILDDVVENIVKVRVTNQDGNCARSFAHQNHMTFACGTVVMNAMLQSGPFQVTHLYLRYGTSGNPGNLMNPGGDLRTATRDDFVRVTTDTGGIWVPVLSAPKQSSSDPNLYVGNMATYFFRIPGTPAADQMTGNWGTSSNQKIYAMGLAVAANILDRSQDVIISTLQDFEPFPIPAGAQAAVDYPFQFVLRKPATQS